jgi:uncharacterized protein YndB with AHSA1/START domain
MTTVRLRTTIAAPPTEVFALYMDADRRPEWNPAARGLIERSGPVNQAGSRYVVDTRFGPFEVHLLRVEPPRLVELREGVGRSGEAHVRIHFDSTPEGGTQLTSESTFAARGRIGQVGALLSALGARLYGALELHRFKAAAERAHASTARN